MPNVTPRAHKAGGFILMLDGVIGAVVGLGLLVLAAAGGGSAVPGLTGLSVLPAGLAGGVLLVVSVIEAAGGRAAYHGRNWYASMAAGVLALTLGSITFVLGFLGVFLVAISEDHFGNASTS